MHQTARFAGFALAITMLAPALAAADTVSDLQNQIQTLLGQVKTLQQQLFSLRASSTTASTTPGMLPPGQVKNAACLTLTRDLRMGARGEDVKQIQNLLAEDTDIHFDGGATGVFGPKMANAMARFQLKMGIASSTDGSVGPRSRAFFMRGCGEGQKGENKLGEGRPAPMMGGIGMMPKGAFAAGTVASNTGSVITITTPDNKTMTVNIVASTSIELFATATSTPAVSTISSLTIGMMAVADGTPNSDGSITAMHVRAAPAGIRIPTKDGAGPRLDDVMQTIGGVLRGLSGEGNH